MLFNSVMKETIFVRGMLIVSGTRDFAGVISMIMFALGQVEALSTWIVSVLCLRQKHGV